MDCDSGPGRIVIDKDRGEIIDMRFYVGGRWRANPSATDLGQLSTRETADLLLHISRTEDNKAGRNAIFPLTVIDSVDIGPDLLRVARDDTRPRETRKQAVFWLGQLAEGPATAGLRDLVGEDAVDREVREQAVFALSRALPGVAAAVTGLEIRIRPQRAKLADLLSPPSTRLMTPIRGLVLAGEDAEPLPAISGRAGRLAARHILSPERLSWERRLTV